MNEQKALADSTAREDKASKTRTLYDVGPFEIFWRNLLAGASRAFGGIIFYLLFLFLVGVLFAQLVMPIIQPIMDKFMDMSSTLENLNNIKLPTRLSF